jgi:DNA-binding MarR family transcriptional regulator
MHGYMVVKARPRRLRDQKASTTVATVTTRNSQAFYERLTALLRSLREVRAQAYATLDLGSAQAKLLRHIGQQSRISQADLARATDTAPTLTGRALEPLVERGWVRRKRSEEDRRQYVLELSAAGQRVRDRVETVREGIIEQMATVLDDRDFADFDRIATKILAVFGEPPDNA